MNLRGLPFTLYDFLGYFVPGALFLYLLTLLHAYVAHPPQDHGSFELSVSLSRIDILPFAIASYALGHLLSFASAATVERFSLLLYQQPSKYLLSDTPLARGEAVSAWSLLNCALMAPVALVHLLVGRFFRVESRFIRSLDPHTRALIRAKVGDFIHAQWRQIGLDPAPFSFLDHDFYHPVYHHAVEHAQGHQSKMQVYVALAGFLRVLTLLLILTVWLVGTVFLSSPTTTPKWWSLVVLSSFSAWLSFLGYLKFNRRFTSEVLFAFTSTYPPND